MKKAKSKNGHKEGKEKAGGKEMRKRTQRKKTKDKKIIEEVLEAIDKYFGKDIEKLKIKIKKIIR